MKTGTGKNGKRLTESQGDDICFTLDADKIREGLTQLAELGKSERKAALVALMEKAKGAKLTPEEDQELDKHVDGGKTKKPGADRHNRTAH